MASYTTTEFLAAVRRLAHVPDADTTFLDSDLLAFADEELQVGVLPQILSVREGFYMAPPLDYEIDGTTYAIPSRTIGSRIANISLVSGTNVFQYARTEVSQIYATQVSPEAAYSFYLEGNNFVILPTPTSGTIRVRYYRRPNKLVTVSECAQVQTIDRDLNTVTVSSIPTAWTGGTLVDLLQAKPGFDWLAIDQECTQVVGTTISFASVPEDLQEGDWIALAGESPVLQMPLEFQPLLTQRVVIKVLEAQGYLPKMEAAQKKLQEMEKAVFQLINPRVDQNPKVIVSTNGTLGFSPRTRYYNP